jgi:hypothetical protein
MDGVIRLQRSAGRVAIRDPDDRLVAGLDGCAKLRPRGPRDPRGGERVEVEETGEALVIERWLTNDD